MNQPKNIDFSSLEKLLSIGLIIFIVVTVTAILAGGEVYFWQKSVAAKERQRLLTQIDKLQNEIQALKEEKSEKPSPTRTNQPGPKVEIQDNVYKSMLAGQEGKVILALKNYNLDKLASYIHPSKGVRFSPYSYIDLKQDLVFSAAQIRKMARNNGEYVWGYYDTTGLPVKMSFEAYFQSFVYDCDYANDGEVGYNQSVTNSITVNNLFNVYRNAIVAEFRYSRTNSSSQLADWRNLKLVFEKADQNWYLVGIIHDQWTM